MGSMGAGPVAAPGGAVNGYAPWHIADNVGVFFMHIGMQHEACAVHAYLPLDHIAVMVHQDQVRHFSPPWPKCSAHRVGPIEFRMLGVAHRQVACKAIIEPGLRKRRGSLLITCRSFLVPAFFIDIGESGNSGITSSVFTVRLVRFDYRFFQVQLWWHPFKQEQVCLPASGAKLCGPVNDTLAMTLIAATKGHR